MPDNRPVSYPPGETIYREYFYRAAHPDGTVVDGPPLRIGKGSVAEVFARTAAALRGVEVTRFERTVTVVAGEWAEVEAHGTESSEPASAADTEKAFCRRLLCGCGRRHHPDGGPCTSCGSPEKCEGYIGSDSESGPA